MAKFSLRVVEVGAEAALSCAPVPSCAVLVMGSATPAVPTARGDAGTARAALPRARVTHACFLKYTYNVLFI